MEFKDHKRKKQNPETTELWVPLRTLMRCDGWYVKKIHGSEFQSGLPDVFASHHKYGPRWIELKMPGNTLSTRQIEEFCEMAKAGVKIWVITSIEQYKDGILHRPPNWQIAGTNIFSLQARQHRHPLGGK